MHDQVTTHFSNLQDIEPIAAGGCGGVMAAGAALLQEAHDGLHRCGVQLVSGLQIACRHASAVEKSGQSSMGYSPPGKLWWDLWRHITACLDRL